MKTSTKVIIRVDPQVNVNYAGFYLYGLYAGYGQKNVRFSNKPFKKLENRVSCFNFTINDKKYCIDFGEETDIKATEYAWCDVYGKVNVNFKQTIDTQYDKIVVLPPFFGIKLWGHIDSFIYAWKSMWKTLFQIFPPTHITRYRKQCRYRVPYEDYNKIPNTKEDYIFHISSVWLNEDWHRKDEVFNESNAFFIKACQSIPEIKFDGGLSMSSKEHCKPSLRNFACEGSFSIKEYLEKTNESLLVFNTPFSNGNNGWKLGEYLALGKTIISTPITNELPAPLVHGEHIHFVENNEEAIKEAILLIKNDATYRQKLEKGAKQYWETYGNPIKILDLLNIKYHSL